MAKVCVACGLTVDASGNLITNTLSTWPFGCDQEDLGGDVYCSPVDGALRTAPPAIAFTNTSSGSRGAGSVANGDTDIIDTADITLTNPSTCFAARVLMVFEVDIQMILDVGESARMDLDGDRYYRFTNQGNATLNTVDWQMSRTRVINLTPGQVLPVSVPIELTAQGGAVGFSLVNWRANAIVVATQ